MFGKIVFEKIEYLPVAIKYHKGAKGLKSGMQSHRLKPLFPRKNTNLAKKKHKFGKV